MKRTYIRSLLEFVFASLFLTFSFVSTPAKAAAAATEAPSTHKAVLTTNRAAGTANYTVTGLDLASDTALTINAVNSSTKKTAFTKNSGRANGAPLFFHYRHIKRQAGHCPMERLITLFHQFS